MYKKLLHFNITVVEDVHTGRKANGLLHNSLEHLPRKKIVGSLGLFDVCVVSFEEGEI